MFSTDSGCSFSLFLGSFPFCACIAGTVKGFLQKLVLKSKRLGKTGTICGMKAWTVQNVTPVEGVWCLVCLLLSFHDRLVYFGKEFLPILIICLPTVFGVWSIQWSGIGVAVVFSIRLGHGKNSWPMARVVPHSNSFLYCRAGIRLCYWRLDERCSFILVVQFSGRTLVIQRGL